MKKSWLLVGLFLVIIISLINFKIYENVNSGLVKEDIQKLDKAYYEYYGKEPEKNKNDKYLSLKDLYDKKSSEYLSLLSNDIVNVENEIRLYRLENTSSFSEDNKMAYEKTLDSIKESYGLLSTHIKGHDYTSSVDELKIIKNKIDDLNEILKDELSKNKEVMQIYNDAQQNKNTANKLVDNCFEKQDLTWDYDKKVSKAYCDSLGLKDCGKDSFVGYTMNDPKAVNAKLPQYSYVSFSNSYFKDKVIDFSKEASKYRFIVEVYSKNINNHKIYKYNVIGLPLDYKLSCTIPGN